ncbi:hypothetical protein BBP40_012719 [Aspergillus hancockii]|nr:hypothetical protein BBP40_012719 [Aspergillus hancockii]
MRRRLWWQICTLDVRTAEDHGCERSILESSFNTKLPLNINDTSLDANMGKLPQSQSGRTEMSYSLVRFEGSHFVRRMVFPNRYCRNNSYPLLDETQKCKEIDKFKERIETQYLSYCDTRVPLDFITAASTRLILVKLKLAVCKPQKDRDKGIPMRASYQKLCEEVLHSVRRDIRCEHEPLLEHYWLRHQSTNKQLKILILIPQSYLMKIQMRPLNKPNYY